MIYGRSRRIQQSKSELYPSGGAFWPSQRCIRRGIHRKVKQKRIGSWRLSKSPSCSGLLSQHRRSRCTARSQSRLRQANASGQPPDAKIMDPFRPHHPPFLTSSTSSVKGQTGKLRQMKWKIRAIVGSKTLTLHPATDKGLYGSRHKTTLIRPILGLCGPSQSHHHLAGRSIDLKRRKLNTPIGRIGHDGGERQG